MEHFRYLVLGLLATTMGLIPRALAAPVEDEVVDLPGLPYPPSFRHYSGYLDSNDDKQLHYWFVECEQEPSTAPLLLWLNGGPGCSSVDGLLAGNGPFHVNNDSKTLYYNIYSWNKVANVIYLESPVGVGFSYSPSNKNYTAGDDQTASDNYMALQSFFKKFPEYASNEFYLTGESYAGVYIPTLAVLIANGSYSMNLKGIAVGNGVHDKEMNVISVLPFARYHGLITPEIYTKLLNECCSPAVPLPQTCHINASNEECAATILEATAFVLESRVNPYGIYDDCQTTFGIDEFLLSNSWMVVNAAQRPMTRDTFLERYLKKLEKLRDEMVDSIALPCQSSLTEALWVNQPEVRAALHIPNEVPLWKDCNSVILYTYDQQYETLAPHYHYLLPRMPALLYNGDTDCVCNFIGGEWFADSLGQENLQPYQPWTYQNQTAGFVKIYSNLTFATVLGSGHMVPTDKPGPALQMITNFLFGEPFTS